MWKIPPKKRSMRILHLIKPKLHFMFRGNINISLCYWQLPDNKFPIPEIAMKSGKKSIFLAFYRGLKIYFCCYFLEFFEKNILIFRKKYLNISKKRSTDHSAAIFWDNYIFAKIPKFRDRSNNYMLFKIIIIFHIYFDSSLVIFTCFVTDLFALREWALVRTKSSGFLLR